MLKLLTSNDTGPHTLMPGDTISVVYKSETLICEPITDHMIIDKVGVLEIRDELGFKHALAGIFGEAK